MDKEDVKKHKDRQTDGEIDKETRKGTRRQIYRWQ